MYQEELYVSIFVNCVSVHISLLLRRDVILYQKPFLMIDTAFYVSMVQLNLSITSCLSV